MEWGVVGRRQTRPSPHSRGESPWRKKACESTRSLWISQNSGCSEKLRGLNSKPWTGGGEVGFPLGEDPEDRRQGVAGGLSTKPHLLIDLQMLPRSRDRLSETGQKHACSILVFQ